MVFNGELDTKEANCLIFACNSALGAIRTDEYRRKVEELEALLMEREEEKK